MADAERAMLTGTRYANAVNPRFADPKESGIDVLSFMGAGIPRYIEVKTTLYTNPDTPYDYSESALCARRPFPYMLVCGKIYPNNLSGGISHA